MTLCETQWRNPWHSLRRRTTDCPKRQFKNHFHYGVELISNVKLKPEDLTNVRFKWVTILLGNVCQHWKLVSPNCMYDPGSTKIWALILCDFYFFPMFLKLIHSHKVRLCTQYWWLNINTGRHICLILSLVRKAHFAFSFLDSI